MTFSIDHGSQMGLNLIMHIFRMKYGERPGKIWINRSDKMEILEREIFLAHPLSTLKR